MIIKLGMVIFFVLFVLYWRLVPMLIDAILESAKLRGVHWLLVGVFNVVVIWGTWNIYSNILVSYGIMTVLMFVEFALFYKDKLSGVMFCTLACMIHVIAVFMITLGLASLSTGLAPYEILSNYQILLWCCVISFSLLNIAILSVFRIVPLFMVKLINQHKEQQRFIIPWMVINILFLLYMANLFYRINYPWILSWSQIAASLAMVIGLYIVLFFSIKTSNLLGYKEKNMELEQAIQQEQQYRNFVVRDALATYEVNVTQDLFLDGVGEHIDKIGNESYYYMERLISISQKWVHSEDIPEFLKNNGRTNILRLFERGEREFITEYRWLLETGEYIWVRTIANLVQDEETGDINAFVCVKNIDDEKKKQLELKRLAERDSLTGLYNRCTASKLIDEYLLCSKRKADSALLMIDVDDFKDINDHLGHIYGDAVLCELAEKLTGIFRREDIVGRIGGDEYIVFMKEGATPQVVSQRAEAICKAFHITYQGFDKKKENLINSIDKNPQGSILSYGTSLGYTISSSVGIALFPRHGKNFKELYAHADIALYTAKGKDKNGYQIYDGSSFAGYTSKRTEIHALGNIIQKGFRENRIEYVFKMLYQSENPVTAIHSVLELIARHFSFERGYIFETSKDGKTSSNTFEWCAEDVSSEIDNLQNLPIEVVATAHRNFQKCGIFILKSLVDLPAVERAVLEPQGIKSMFQFGIFDKSRLLGFIGFDNCRNESLLNDIEIDEMNTICNILSTFFVKQYIDEVSQKDLLARQEVMNHLENYIYVINTETFELLFMNAKIQTILNESKEGTACYNFFRGKEKQCDDCPMRKLVDTNQDRVVEEIYNEKLGIWMETSASLMRWTDGKLACLINCTNITKQKEDHLTHVDQLEKLIYVDVLTGDRTYHKFKIDAQRILEKYPDELHFLVKLDIANFKLINQIYGYEKGNEVLCCVSKALEHMMRNENEIFARISNDEFIALFTLQNKNEIEGLNRKFIDNFQEFMGSDFSFQCKFPHGRFLVEPGYIRKVHISEMFEKVNVAHKAAKAEKTIEFTFYDEQMTKEALRVKKIENRMADALKNEEFVVYLQPKYFLEDEQIGGAEALVRWKNENTDLFLPGTFIPVFEQDGFVTKLDFYVFEKVCWIIKSWIVGGVEPVTVSVNFSRLHLDNPDFVIQLCEIADRVGIERKYLEIEITETAILDNIDSMEVILSDIHDSGFTMSMDDFGSGYSSLGMLKDLHVDVIKMDRSFFVDQKDLERSKSVVGCVIQMAAEIGIRIVAEGVEEKAHIDFLRALKCDMVQGYYYAKPMPVEQFTELLFLEQDM